MSSDETRREELDQALTEGLIGIPEYVLALLDVATLREELTSPDPEARVVATFEGRNRREAQVTRILAQALTDEEEEVRLFAAEALELHDARFQRAIRELRGELERAPTPELRERLGLLYFRYAEVACDDPDLAPHYYRLARELLAEAGGAGAAPRYARAVAALRTGDLPAATAGLEELAAGEEDPRILVTLADAYLRAGRVREVRELAPRLAEVAAAAPAARRWTGEDRE